MRRPYSAEFESTIPPPPLKPSHDYRQVLGFLLKHRLEGHTAEFELCMLEYLDVTLLASILRSRGLHFLSGIAMDDTAYGSRQRARQVNAWQTTAMEKAAARGHLELVRYFFGLGTRYTSSAMEQAAARGHLDVVQFLHEKRPDGHTSTAHRCAQPRMRNNFLRFNAFPNQYGDLLVSMRTRPGIQSVRGINVAQNMRDGHVGRVNGLVAQAPPTRTTFAMESAAANGHLATVRYLHETHVERCTTAAMDGAASCGHLAIVKYLHENRTEGCTTAAMDRAASSGHGDVVKFLHTHRREGFGWQFMDVVASTGNVRRTKRYSKGCSAGKIARAMLAARTHDHSKVHAVLKARLAQLTAESSHD